MPNILIICSRYPTIIQPQRNIFIKEQIEAVRKLDSTFHFDVFQINRNSRKINYLTAVLRLRSIIKQKTYNLFHAHYGLSALSSVWQKRIPVIATYHGSDINTNYSRFCIKWIIQQKTTFNIFVNQKHSRLMKNPKNSMVIPCGVDLDIFHPLDKNYARAKLGWSSKKKYIVFPSEFKRFEKNSSMAKKAIAHLGDNNVNLIELKGYTRNEVNYILNASDLLLMTSISEGSPQTIKEAMACNLPIVSTDVGDVREVIGNTEGCFITTCRLENVVEKIQMALDFNKRTNGHKNINHLDINNVAEKIISVYKYVLRRKIEIA